MLSKKKIKIYAIAAASSIAAIAALFGNIQTIVNTLNRWILSNDHVEIISISTDTDRTFLYLKSDKNVLTFEYGLEDSIINNFLQYNPDIEISKLSCAYDASLSKYERHKWDYGLGINDHGGRSLRFSNPDGYKDCLNVIDKIRNMSVEEGLGFHDPVFDVVMLNKSIDKLLLKEIAVEILEFRHPLTTGYMPGQFDTSALLKPAVEYEINLSEMLMKISKAFPKKCIWHGLVFPGALTRCENLLSRSKEYSQNIDKVRLAMSTIEFSKDGYPLLKTVANDKVMLNLGAPVRFQIRLPTDTDSDAFHIVMRFNFVISDERTIVTKPLSFWYSW